MSDYLVDTVEATKERGSLTTALAAVYCHLAKTWIAPVTPATVDLVVWRDFARRVRELNGPVNVAAVPHVNGGRWAAVEILNALNHIEVVLAAALTLEDETWTPKRCAPTQQHLSDGENEVPSRIADLEGKDENGKAFALEAYGGANYQSNSKLALDLNALRQSKKPRLLLAARKSAWSPNLQTRLKASCDKRNGGPFMIEATIEKSWQTEQVLMLELSSIVRDDARPKLPS